MYLLASYYEFVNTIRRVQTYLKGNSWSMFWETFLDPITFREIRKHNHILISMNEIRTPPWQQTNDWLTARKTKPYVMANDDVAKRQHIFLASLFARCYRSRYWKFEFTDRDQSAPCFLLQRWRRALSPDIVKLSDREPILQIAAMFLASKMAARAFSRYCKAQWLSHVSVLSQTPTFLSSSSKIPQIFSKFLKSTE